MRIHVQDFQSLADVTLDVNGFTVVTGTNNAGKSALARAIRSAFQNASGISYIRNGKSKAKVEIDFGDGHSLVWEKGRGKGDKPTYIIDKGNPIYPGKGVPDEVRELGVQPIVVGGREIWPQFAPQFTGQIFLLDQPGSVLAEAVADVDRVGQLNAALRSAESDKRSAGSELKVRLSDKDQLERELTKFEGLDDCQTAVDILEKNYQKAVSLEKLNILFKELQKRLSGSRIQVATLSGIDAIDIPKTDVISNLEQLQVELKNLYSLRDRYRGAQKLIGSLSGIEKSKLPEDASFKALEQDTFSLISLSELSLRLKRVENLVKKLAEVEKLADPPDGEPIVTHLTTLVFIEELRRKHQGTNQRILGLNEELEKMIQQETDVETEFSSQLGAWGSCPVCGTLFSKDHKHI